VCVGGIGLDGEIAWFGPTLGGQFSDVSSENGYGLGGDAPPELNVATPLTPTMR
jgi:hypothetical protein